MKIIILLPLLFSFYLLNAQAKKATKSPQAKQQTSSKVGKGVKTIIVKNEPIYLINNIDYNIIGLYENTEGDFDNVTKTYSKEPITQLNADGTGLWQNFGTNKVPIVWGIECEKDGTPKKNETPYGAMYRLWYQIKAKFIVTDNWNRKIRESGEIDAWDIVDFGINFSKKIIVILGSRVKNY